MAPTRFRATSDARTPSPRTGPRLKLQTKLVASYVALGLCIALISLLGGFIQSEASRQISVRENLLRRTSDTVALADSAAEEGFAFVLSSNPEEKRRRWNSSTLRLPTRALCRSALGSPRMNASC